MTRFARAKGSKSSNERVPEASTPWEVMSKQLTDQLANKEDSEERAKFEAKRKENYENFLKEEITKKTQKTWCEFPVEETKKLKESSKEVLPSSPKKKNKMKKEKKANESNIESMQVDSDVSIDVDDPELSKWCDEYSDQETNEKYKSLTSELEKYLQKKTDKSKKQKSSISLSDNVEKDQKKKSKKRKLEKGENESEITETQKFDDKETQMSKKKKSDDSYNGSDDVSSKNIKNKKNKKKNKSIDSLNKDNFVSVEIVDKSVKPMKKNKKSPEPCENDDSEITAVQSEVINKKKKKKRKPKNKKKIDVDVTETENNTSYNGNTEVEVKKTKQSKGSKTEKQVAINKESSKKNKDKDNKEFKRRKPQQEGQNILIINGEEVETVTLHGFPITAKDGQRIQELRKNLISKGIPRSEVERTIKLERRRAEKTLARLKKTLCFHCRKGGHMLSECPELNKDGNISTMPNSGLCFKCGSTEHTHFACKVVRTQDYKFAQCFICKEQGHISRQCPDNPKGIYPKGGACRVCGDVTHLRKDCPQVLQKNEDNTIRLETLEPGNVEDIGQTVTKNTKSEKSSVKRVKF